MRASIKDLTCDLIDRWAELTPQVTAIAAPGRIPLTYGQLRYQVDDVVQQLNAIGLGRGDRIAVVLPNGPDIAVCFLAVTCCATFAPLNCGYTANEFEFYLSDLGAKALIVQDESDSTAIAVAQARGIPVLRLAPTLSAAAGVFKLASDRRSTCSSSGWSKPEDVALILHTSGTTGRPKLVPLTQANLCASAENTSASLELSGGDCCLNMMPLFHVHGLIGALLSSVAAGAGIVCTSGFNAIEFFQWMEEFQPTWFTAVPTIHQGILTRARLQARKFNTDSLRFIRSCSAPLPPRIMARLEEVFDVPVVEAYGMTEASHQISINPLPPKERKPGSVGVPVGQQVGIMDDAGNLLPVGAAGEIVIRGPNVTRGYISEAANDGKNTEEGWFHTGDLGYLDADGYLFLSARIGEIINRGGEKISPREVDEVLLNHPAVEAAVAFAIPNTRLGQEVGAAVVLREDLVATEIEIKEFVALRLADFKVPQRVVFVKELPREATGKVRRIGLAEGLGLVDSGDPTPKKFVPHVGPRTQMERRLTEIWREVLRLERVGIDDDFFDLGGDSLLATQIISRVLQMTGLEFSIVNLFHKPTITSFAEWLDSAESPPNRSNAPAIQPIPRGSDLPVSFGEQRIWFMSQYAEDNAVYVTPIVLRLEGALDVTALKRSLNKIVERHEVLRTTFRNWNGVPERVISLARPMTLPTVDVAGQSAGERLSQGLRLAAEEIRHPFDLSRDLMLRATLLKLGQHDHLFSLAIHHVASDAWSRNIFFRDLAELYEAEVSNRPDKLRTLPIQYVDFASWQQQRMRSEGLENEAAYWKKQLAGSAILQLPTDRPRPKRQTYKGSRESLVLPQPLSHLLRELSRREGVTVFMTLLAALHTLLYRYTGQADTSVGTPIANRTRVETEGLIGFLVNPVVMRLDLSDDPTFSSLLDRLRRVALEAYAHQDMPFEKLVEVLQPERNPSHSPLFQVMFTFDTAPAEILSLPGLVVRNLELDNGTSKFDLTLSLTDDGQRIAGFLEYNTDLFDASTVRGMADHYLRLLGGAVKKDKQRVSRLPLLSADEIEQLVVKWNNTDREYPQRSVQSLFEVQAERNPSAVAVAFESQEMTYGELDRRANQLAQYLQKLGVKQGVLVGVFVDRSMDLVIALLGVLKAGGAYVPIDPMYPSERISYVLADSAASILLTQEELAHKVPAVGARVVSIDTDWVEIACESIQPPCDTVSPEDLAYVTYTSGSTGKPKAVQIPHGALTNLLCSMREKPGLSCDDIFLAVTTISFDIAALELFLPLCVGAKIVIASRTVAADGRRLLGCLADSGATVIQATPITFRLLVEAGWSGNSKLKILCGGEALPRELANQLLDRSASLWNMYGPTETTIWSSTLQVQRGTDSVRIGPPIHNTQFYVLDVHGQLVPRGVPGELHIGGAGLALGYLGRPELTADRFIPNPFQTDRNDRLYRTGDLVRRIPDGSFEFLGRLDGQIKLRGFRIELGEIESVLREHHGVRDCAVVARDEFAGAMCLVAYIVAEPSQAPSTSELLGVLKQKLPGHMVPSKLIFVECIPLTPNGKVDRQRLPAPEKERTQNSPLPRDSLEARLAAIWEELLGVHPIGVRDNFFELGGDSLSALRLLYQIERRLHKNISVPSLFEAPTIEDLANILQRHGQSAAPSYLVPLQTNGFGTPLFCVHGLSGELFDFVELARCLGPHRPVYGLQARIVNGRPVAHSLKAMAATYVGEIRSLQPEGPYLLAGHSAGGTIALEIAQQMRASGQPVAMVVALDALYPGYLRELPSRAWTRRIAFHLRKLARLDRNEILGYLRQRGQTMKEWVQRKIWQTRFRSYPAGARTLPGSLAKVDEIHRHAIKEYAPQAYDGRVVLFRCMERRVVDADFEDDLGWSKGVTGSLVIHEVPGDHVTMLAMPLVQGLAEKLEVYLKDACAAKDLPDAKRSAQAPA